MSILRLKILHFSFIYNYFITAKKDIWLCKFKIRIDDVILKIRVIISYLFQGLTRIFLSTTMDASVNAKLDTDDKCSRKNVIPIVADFKSLWSLVQGWTTDMSYISLYFDLFVAINDVMLKIIIISHLVQGPTRIFLGMTMDTNFFYSFTSNRTWHCWFPKAGKRFGFIFIIFVFAGGLFNTYVKPSNILKERLVLCR